MIYNFVYSIEIPSLQFLLILQLETFINNSISIITGEKTANDIAYSIKVTNIIDLVIIFLEINPILKKIKAFNIIFIL